MTFNVHWTHIIWCLGLELTFQTFLSTFCLLLDVFSTTYKFDSYCPILQSQASLILKAFISSTLWVSIYYNVPMAVNAHVCMMSFVMFKYPQQKKLFYFSCGLKTFTHFSFFHVLDIQKLGWNCLLKGWVPNFTNIINANPTYVNILSQTSCAWSFASLEVAQTNEWSYEDYHWVNQFLLLTIKVLNCLHEQGDNFLQGCANIVWGMKGPKGPFCNQKKTGRKNISWLQLFSLDIQTLCNNSYSLYVANPALLQHLGVIVPTEHDSPYPCESPDGTYMSVYFRLLY
jgi:hypothetical protein